MSEYISSLIIPLVLALTGLFMAFGKKDYFESFLEGAREGFSTAIKLLPTLVALVVAIRMLTSSGALEVVSDLLSGISGVLGIPTELLPLLLTRPFSGSASLAGFSALLEECGADSFAALLAAVIMGSSDTLVYVISVYFSSVGIKKTRHAFPVAIASMLFCIIFSCFICKMWFNR